MRIQAAIKCTGLVAILVVLFVLTSQAQVSTATITGVVQDSTGAVVPGAEITATQTETNYHSKTMSGDNGAFSLPSLPVGAYTLTVKAQGFSPYKQTGLVLQVSQVVNVSVALKVGGTEQSVEVVADAATVQTSESTIQSVVPEAIVSELPLNGRNAAALLFTVAGVTDAALNMGGPTKNAALSTVTGAGFRIPGSVAPTTHGIQSGGTYFALDGASNIDPYAILGGPFPNPDATQEFSVATGSYGARYISAPGGAVNVVTKSGTNSVHGAVFEYLRNGFFNSKKPITAQEDILKRNQFGGAIGAPIIKDRWFVFGSYQGTRQSDLASSRPTRVPTQDERNGLFTTPFGTTAQIPAPLLSHVVQGLMAYLPLPNLPGGNYAPAGIAAKNKDEQWVIKSDFNLGNHRFFGRYFSDHFLIEGRKMVNSNFFTSGGESHSDWDTFVVGDTYSRGNWVVESRVSQSQGLSRGLPDPVAGAVTLKSLGALSFTPGVSGGLPIMDWGSVVAGGGATDLPRTTWDVSEDISVVKNKHQISFGANFRRVNYTQANAAGQSGVTIFTGLNSLGMFGPLQAQSVADLMLGAPMILIQGDGFFNSSTGKLFGLYVEDKYRVTQKLTLTAGLRWDPYLPYTAESNQVDCWIPGQKSKVYTNAPTGLNYPGDPGCGEGGTSAKYKTFEPRIGLAWDPTGNGKMSIRAAYGVYSIQQGLQTFQGFSAPPWVRTFNTVRAVVFGQAPISLDNVYASAGLTDPFAGGFNGVGFAPAKDVAFPSAPFGLGAISKDYKPGYVQQWTLSIQRALTDNDSIEATYVGTKGTHIGSAYDTNLPVWGPGATTNNEQARRPFQSFAAISILNSNANSNYNGLELTYNHRMKWGLFANSSFSWSKCMDEGSQPATTGGLTTISNDPSLRRGLCDFDQNYVWRTTATWQLPKFKGANAVVRALLGDWAASGLLAVDAGQPFSVADNSDPSRTGLSGFQVDPIAVADRVPGVPVWVNGTLNYAAFAPAAAGTFGNSGRNSFRATGLRNVDFSMMKNIPVTERFKVVFRAEAFNLLNHTNLFPPNANYTAGSQLFGTYTAARDPRIMQFSLRFTF